MAKITQIYKAVGKVLRDNTEMLQGKTVDEMEDILTATVGEFVEKNKKHGDKMLAFRLHYSGDFFSEDYATAWARTIAKFPRVRFWVYSRSHQYAKIFENSFNLTFFLSVDVVNWQSALEHWERVKHLPNFGLAWLGTQAAPTEGGMRWVKCPETSGRLPNLPDAGACSRCRLCVNNYVTKVKNIAFAVH